MGDKGEGRHTVQQTETRRKTRWETSWETSWETRSGRQAAGQGRQGLGNADTPSNKGGKNGDKLRQAKSQERRPRKGGHIIQQRAKNYTPVGPKQFFHIHCSVCVHVCVYTSSWCWQLLSPSIVSLLSGVYAGVIPETTRRHKGSKED